jgi:hypothetical protein
MNESCAVCRKILLTERLLEIAETLRLESLLVVQVDRMRRCIQTAATNGPIVHPPDNIWVWRATVEWETRRTRRKTCPSATMSTINSTWNGAGANPGLCGERPASNHLSHDTVDSLSKNNNMARSSNLLKMTAFWVCIALMMAAVSTS